ncbi:TRAP transporter small permease [Bacillus massiliglaciei]|uniref:TRAP transporter small permease n=1 Tax=Bacillus massiliglaciei TaxID=1816693 RepID=UPI000AC100CA|nr:TRAP transporter small permease [Bacillus massiliglaciei]
MIGVLRGYLRVIDFVNQILGWILALMLGLMTVLITWQVFARFVVGNSLTFSEEVARFLMIWITLLGAAYAARQGTLIAVELMPDLLKGAARKAVRIIAHFLALVFYIILIRYGWEIAQSVSFQRAPATAISMFWPMLGICAGGVFLFLNTLAVLFEEVIGKEER